MTDRVVQLERERRRALAGGAHVPHSEVRHVRRIETGRSTDPVWWVTGLGWACVVKVLAPVEDGLDWDVGARELAAHRSGVLAALPPGLRAPRLLAAVEREDGATAMWLEGLDGPVAAHWPFSWYRVAAAGLGRTQGAYVAGLPLPDGDWLNQGSIAQYVEEHPCGEQQDDGPSARLRCDERVVQALEELPRTLCHFDLHPRNLIVGDGNVVALDWSSVGIGTLGEDPSTLVASAVLDGHVLPGRLRDLFLEVVQGYADGLRAAGLEVDDDALARVLGALLVVRLGWVVERRLRDDRDDDSRDAAQALADVLAELAEQAHQHTPRDAVRVPRDGAA